MSSYILMYMVAIDTIHMLSHDLMIDLRTCVYCGWVSHLGLCMGEMYMGVSVYKKSERNTLDNT